MLSFEYPEFEIFMQHKRIAIWKVLGKYSGALRREPQERYQILEVNNVEIHSSGHRGWGPMEITCKTVKNIVY